MRLYETGTGIHNTRHFRIYCSIDFAVLETTVTVRCHCAVNHHQIRDIAQGLSTRDTAIDQLEILGIPAYELAIYFRVIDRHILCVPECVAGIKHGVSYYRILYILERIVSILPIILDIDILAMHEYIIGILNLHIPEFYITAIPESFLRMRYLHILQGDP